MVYLLTLLSDFPIKKVTLAIGVDVALILSGLIGFTNPFPFNILILVSFALFPLLMKLLIETFDAALSQSHVPNTVNLHILRNLTVGIWVFFPVNMSLCVMGVYKGNLNIEEWVWGLGDFLGKIMFASSLLYGNFLTIEQRRLIAMRIVEEANRVQVIKELNNLMEQKERFLSSVSHELRTPLNGIIGLSDAISSGSCGQVTPQVIKTIGTIKSSGARLLNLVNDILDAASMRKG